MSVEVGAFLRCDHYSGSEHCGGRLSADSKEELRSIAETRGWTRANNRDYCPSCSERRAARTKLADVVPEGTVLLKVFDAARAAGFAVQDVEDDDAKVECCGQPVEVRDLLGAVYAAECRTCGASICDASGPSFGNGTVWIMDSNKIDAETEFRWVAFPAVVAEPAP